jgi:hypothetical protein
MFVQNSNMPAQRLVDEQHVLDEVTFVEKPPARAERETPYRFTDIGTHDRRNAASVLAR